MKRRLFNLLAVLSLLLCVAMAVMLVRSWFVYDELKWDTYPGNQCDSLASVRGLLIIDHFDESFSKDNGASSRWSIDQGDANKIFLSVAHQFNVRPVVGFAAHLGEGQATGRAAASSELRSLVRTPTRSDSSGTIADAEPLAFGPRLTRTDVQSSQAVRSAGVRKAARPEGFADKSRDLLTSSREVKTSRRINKLSGVCQKLG